MNECCKQAYEQGKQDEREAITNMMELHYSINPKVEYIYMLAAKKIREKVHWSRQGEPISHEES